jgi:uncharacterized protein (TIGR02217 family)
MGNVDDILFPLSVDRFMSAPRFNTTIINLGNGAEIRIANWDDGRVEFNAALGVRSLLDLQRLIFFHRRRKGNGRPFLVRDLLDFKVLIDNPENENEGVFGTGDSATTAFQLKKNYTDDFNTDTRTIRKPQEGTVRIYIDGVQKTETTHYTIDYSTGIVTFTTAPADEAVLEWDGWFYVPVRFMVDRIPVEEFAAVMVLDTDTDEMIVDHAAGEIPDIPMIEVPET